MRIEAAGNIGQRQSVGTEQTGRQLVAGIEGTGEQRARRELFRLMGEYDLLPPEN